MIPVLLLFLFFFLLLRIYDLQLLDMFLESLYVLWSYLVIQKNQFFVLAAMEQAVNLLQQLVVGGKWFFALSLEDFIYCF